VLARARLFIKNATQDPFFSSDCNYTLAQLSSLLLLLLGDANRHKGGGKRRIKTRWLFVSVSLLK
jgi:hypothetical protein